MNGLKREWAAWKAAVMFFTRWPMRSDPHWDPASLQRAAAWFPAVGLLVGVVGAGAWWVAAEVAGLPLGLAAGLSLAATVLFTGGFHEDGWADVCDGFGGGYDKARTLEIMKDSRIGAFGSIGLVLILGMKWQALTVLPQAVIPLAMVVLHGASRSMAGLLMAFLRYVAEEGKAKPLATKLRGGRLIWAMLTGLLPLYFLSGGAVVFLVLMAATLGCGIYFKTKIGGYTGDCLGATQQVVELSGYLALVSWLT